MKTDLIEIFQTIRAQIQPYAVEGFKNKTNSETAYHLYTDQKEGNSELNHNEIYFFGIEIKGHHVELYFRDFYTDEEMNVIFSPSLLHLLKESDCFSFEKLDNLLLQEISNALKSSFKFYKQKGWV